MGKISVKVDIRDLRSLVALGKKEYQIKVDEYDDCVYEVKTVLSEIFKTIKFIKENFPEYVENEVLINSFGHISDNITNVTSEKLCTNIWNNDFDYRNVEYGGVLESLKSVAKTMECLIRYDGFNLKEEIQDVEKILSDISKEFNLNY